MAKATGKVIKLQARKSAKGDSYTVIGLEGQRQAFYDWNSCCTAAGVRAGDTVEIEHSGGNYPRVTGVKKLGAEFKTPQPSQSERPKENKDTQISRMCALKAAAAMLQNRDMPIKDLKDEATKLAGELHRWIMG